MNNNSSYFTQTTNAMVSGSPSDAEFETDSSGDIKSFDPILSSDVNDFKSQI